MPGDYDGDGKTDIAVFRPSTGHWYIVNSSTATGSRARRGAAAGTSRCPATTTATARPTLRVFRPSTGHVVHPQVEHGEPGGADVGRRRGHPGAGDYDGDGKTDIAVFRPSTGHWYIVNSSTASGG